MCVGVGTPVHAWVVLVWLFRHCPAKMLRDSYEARTNFVRNSCEFRTNFVPQYVP